MRNHSVDVILPCLNEAAALPAVIADIHAIDGFRALVVDNGSSDGSAEVAAHAGARVLHEARPGYGAAVHTGLENATADVVCMADADGSIRAADLANLITPLTNGDVRLVVGRREPVNRGLLPWHARAGNAMLAWMLRRQGVPVRDLAPVRAALRDDLLELNIQDRAFGYPLELLIRAGRAGWSMLELPVSYHPRAAGTASKISGSVRGTARTARDMIGVLR